MRLFMDFLDPWKKADENDQKLILELKKELAPSHFLYGKNVEILARRKDNDDVFFEVKSTPVCYAVVHLTWSGQVDQDPRYPWTTIYKSLEEFQQDVEEYL